MFATSRGKSGLLIGPLRAPFGCLFAIQRSVALALGKLVVSFKNAEALWMREPICLHRLCAGC
jgi:hypothetical protein